MHISDLNWSWTKRKYLVSCSFRVTVHVNKNVNAISIDAISGFSVTGNGGQINKVFSISLYLFPKTGVVIRCERIAEYLGKC